MSLNHKVVSLLQDWLIPFVFLYVLVFAAGCDVLQEECFTEPGDFGQFYETCCLVDESTGDLYNCNTVTYQTRNYH